MTVFDRQLEWKQAACREIDEAVSRLEEANEPPTASNVDAAIVRMLNSSGWWPRRPDDEAEEQR